MITENLSTLKIHTLTKEQYENAVESGAVEKNALYLTPDEAYDLSSYATIEYVNEDFETKTDAVIKFNNSKDYTDEQIAIVKEYAEELLSGQGGQGGQTDLNHNHDDRYYTEEEVDSALENKADKTHTHSVSDLTDLQTALDALLDESKEYTDAAISGLDDVDTEHNHDDLYYTQIQIDAALEEKANISHNHSISEVTDLETTLDEKANISHSHNTSDISDLEVTATELNYMIGVTSNIQIQLDGKADYEHNHDSLYDAKDSANKALEDANLYTDEAMKEKADLVHTHSIDEVNELQTALDAKVPTDRTVNGKSLTDNITLTYEDVGADPVDSAKNALETANQYTDEIAKTKSDVGHIHDDMYYTEDEIDAKVSEINTSIKNIVDGNTIVAKATHAATADNATNAGISEKAIHDENGNVITSTYETKADATKKLSEAKSYADSVKNDLLNGAGDAYDTLKELGDLIDENQDAIDALEIVAAGKAALSHASTEPNHGMGTGSDYGHVKLSDSINTTSGASLGVAATPTAVKAAYDLANTAKTRADDAYDLANGRQSKITGTAGQFVVIGDDGNVTTVSLTNVAEVGA